MSAEVLRQYVDPWVDATERELVPALRCHGRFPDAERLIDRFTTSVERWRAAGPVTAIYEAANELAAAHALLERGEREEIVLRYEPKLLKTSRSIDFKVVWPDEMWAWIDVKTIAPRWSDDGEAWQRYERISADFDPCAQLIVHEEWLGAGISGQEIKSRWSFIQYARQAEQKVTLLTDAERGPVWLLFCSNGHFHDGALEDFADFYRFDRFRQDDWACNAIARYMQDENIAFDHSLAGMCFLKREPWDVFASKLAVDVRGPVLGR